MGIVVHEADNVQRITRSIFPARCLEIRSPQPYVEFTHTARQTNYFRTTPQLPFAQTE